MIIKSFTLGELQTNCYLVYDQETKEAVIIDPADDANFIEEEILRLNLLPKYIIATHGHFDHILAAWEIQLAFNIPFLINEKDLFLLKNMQKSAVRWLDRKIIEKAPNDIVFLKNHEKILFGSLNLEVIHTPGHTPGSICLYSKENRLLFSGDTVFSDGIGRSDLSYSSKENILSSIKLIIKYPPNTVIYPGHGETFIHSDKYHYALNLQQI